MNQKGAILPTVLMFVALLLLLTLGTITIYQGQMRQLVVLNNHYEAKELILLAKIQLEIKTIEKNRQIKTMKLEFDNGYVEVKLKELWEYQFVATLKNHYISEDTFSLATIQLNEETAEE